MMQTMLTHRQPSTGLAFLRSVCFCHAACSTRKSCFVSACISRTRRAWLPLISQQKQFCNQWHRQNSLLFWQVAQVLGITLPSTKTKKRKAAAAQNSQLPVPVASQGGAMQTVAAQQLAAAGQTSAGPAGKKTRRAATQPSPLSGDDASIVS